MKTRLAKVLVLLTLVAALVAMMALPAMATNLSLLDGQITISDTANVVTNTDGKVTSKVVGERLSKAENTITVTNNSGSTMTMSFDYAPSNCNSFKIDGTSYSSSGSFSKLVNHGDSVTVYMQSKSGALSSTSTRTATLTLSNFALEALSAEATVTFGSLGSVKVSGAALASGGTASNGDTLVATPVSGAYFVAWINLADNSVISTSASYAVLTDKDIAIEAVFTNTPMFFVGTNFGYLSKSLDAAISYAQSDANKVISLASNATLPAGDYTIPSGITMLIPFDSANTLYTNKPVGVEDYSKPTAYRTLTMASGANLKLEGSLSLSAKHSAKIGYNGAPTGPVSFIKMNSGSAITVKSGAFLYAWGYITGSGSVEVMSGGTVYECFQVTDYRGGDGTSGMATDSKNKSTYHVFPMSQYYLQNVEVPMTLHAGSSEYGYMSVTVTLVGVQSSDVGFIGKEGAMFQLSSGYVIKDYLEGQGRLLVEGHGNISMSTVSVAMRVSGFSNTEIDSANFNLPVSNHFTIDIKEGNISIMQDIVMFPGAELYIRQGATCTIGDTGVEGDTVRIIVFDADQWGNYLSHTNKTFLPLPYVPGGDNTKTRLNDALVQIDGIVDASKGAIYTTAGGANVFSTGAGKFIGVPGAETVTYSATQTANSWGGQDISYTAISIQPALLKNADGSFVDTAAESGTYTYYASTGRWDRPSHFYDDGVVTEPTCVTDGYTTYTCSVCGHSYQDNIVECHGAHNVVTVAGKAATCTETGLTDGHVCDRCGEIQEAQEVIPALGHTEEIISGKKATCTDPGLTEGKHCTVCGEVTVAQKEIAALGHSYASVVTAPTCTEDGYTTYTCSACNDTYRGNEVEALGHTEVTDAAKAATCTETGLTEGKHCSVCGEVLVAQNEIAALGHTEVIDAAKAATCTETGLTEGKHCSVCGEVLVAQNEIAALGHTEVIDAAVAATCTETGLTEGKHCSVCGEVTVAQEEVAALGHSYGDWIVTVAPTYKEEGQKEQTCSACGDVVTEEIEKLANPVIGWNITLKDNIGVNFAMELKGTDVVVVTVNGKTVDFTEENGKFSINVAAAQMMDEIAISVNGLPLENTYSVRKYADTILADSTKSDCHELVKNMLVYGGAAQTYFGYNTAILASNNIEVDAVAPIGDGEVEISDSLSAISFYGATLVHETKTAVRFYFTGSVEGLTFTANDETVSVDKKNDMYYVEIAGINPQDLGENVTVVVTDGTNELTVAYSPLDYIVRMYNKAGTSAALVQALYGYYQAAVAYTA